MRYNTHMESRYDHKLHEENIYRLWEKHSSFSPSSIVNEHNLSKSEKKTKNTQKSSVKSNNTPFSIIMPPPNANDPLHIGHAMFVALEDTMIRYNRMLGKPTVWIPGTDHAGIETQFVFEKKLQKKGKSRFNFDRQTLYNMIWEYVQDNSNTAVDQIKKLGASADWSRFKFTLDEDVVAFVLKTFKKLHNEDKLIYRDVQLVNYCTKCGTSYSELEVAHKEQDTALYYIKYEKADKPGEFIVIATTRPEPLFADTHIAVHPDNKKTKDLIGTQVLNPLTGAKMDIIADEFVNPEFGTGIVKLTPAHDQNDFAVAKKHNLPIIHAITTQGKMTEAAGKYAGLTVSAARKQVVEDLQTSGHIEKVDEKYHNTIGTCYRCGRALEPLPLPQFFIKVNDKQKSLTQAALAALDSGETTIHGAGREKILRHWLENLKDWNISRQIVWGIRIPVWYNISDAADNVQVSFVDSAGTYTQGLLSELLEKHDFEEISNGLQQAFPDQSVPYSVSVEKPSEPGMWLPETDTFDTWFSSAQWPVVTLKTNQPSDFDTFYPTSVMETGYDILPFWVMRMMLMGIYLTGKSPFSDVYLHGLVRDEKGQKMSKSKGNVINPLEIVDEFGADALRMALGIRAPPGPDKSVGRPDFKSMRNISNKIWNASRFIVTNLEDAATISETHTIENADFAKKLNEVHIQVSQQLSDLKLGLAAETTYNEFWHWFCDECIEATKNGDLSQADLFVGLITFLKLLHPFTPFVTEAVWQELHAAQLVTSPTLISSSW